MSLPAEILDARPHPLWDTRRLWSLADMINFGMREFLLCLEFIDGHLKRARAENPDEMISPEHQYAIENNSEKAIFPVIAKLQIDEARLASLKLQDFIQTQWRYRRCTYSELAAILERLWDDLLEGAKQEYFFHYSKEVASIARPVAEGFGVGPEWETIVAKFKSSKREIEAGMDCFAFGDFPGCVFHMMRIAELGLRAIARERGVRSLRGKRGQPKPIEWGTWQDVFEAIEKKVSEIHNATQGPDRDDALAFYQTALSDLRLMRSLYRDPTMHFRETYDKGEAYSAIFRTNTLMNMLAKRLNEENPRKIGWRLR
jgi:hypothetical protein